MTQKVEATLTIVNELGLHARAATAFVQTAGRFESEIFVMKDGREVNGKSIMGIMTLVAAKGSEIELRAEGEDAQAIIEAITQLVADRFGEER